MVFTSIPATSLAVYAEEAPVIESFETVEENAVTTVEETVTEEVTSVLETEVTTEEATEVTTEEETSDVEETTTEVETTTEESTSELELAEDEGKDKFKFKITLIDECKIIDYLTFNAAYSNTDKEYTLDDFFEPDDVVRIALNSRFNEKYTIEKITYSIGEGEEKIFSMDSEKYIIIPKEKVTGDIKIVVTGRKISEPRTVNITKNTVVQAFIYFSSKYDNPTEFDVDRNTFSTSPQHGYIVEKGSYLYILPCSPAPYVMKSGDKVKTTIKRPVQGVSSEEVELIRIGPIYDNINLVISDDTKKPISFSEIKNASATFKSGVLDVSGRKMVWGDKDLVVSVMPKEGYEVTKVEFIPCKGGVENRDPDPYSLYKEMEKVDNNTYRLPSLDVLYCVDSDYDNIKIAVTTQPIYRTVNFVAEGVKFYKVEVDDNGNIVSKGEAITSADVLHTKSLNFAAEVEDAKHKILSSVLKGSGNAGLVPHKDKEGKIDYYTLSNIKSDITIKATTTLTKATGGARFVLEPEEGLAGNVKITSVKGATLDRASGEYKVNANVAEVVITLTANAPYVPALGGAEVAPKAAGVSYSYTFNIPAVDIINTDKGDTVDIASYAITSEAKSVRINADFNSETTELVSIAEGTIGLYTQTNNWDVPFGTTMTVVVKAKDNCKLTAAYVNDKKVAFAKNEKITFKVTDLAADEFRIASQKLLKTVVESNDEKVTGKGTTYNILKQNSAAVYVQEGADGKLDLGGEGIAITSKIGRDDVPYVVSENKIYYASETLDAIAGKTITVAIKDGKKAISTTKLVVSAKCTSVKVQGEKKVGGVDTVYFETATKNNTALKITYNAGVNPKDMVLKYVNANKDDRELDISDGKIYPKQMELVDYRDYALKNEVEVSFVDNSQGGIVVATKKLVFTTKGFEKAAPTVKVVSSNDIGVTLSIANPKVAGEGKSCIYTITAKQVVAKGKSPVEGMYGDNVDNPEVVFENVKPDEKGKIRLKLSALPEGSGKACNYSFTVSGSYEIPSNVNFKPVTVKAATKTPKYETALKITPKKTNFYALEGKVLVGTIKYSTTTTHTENPKATVFINVNDSRYPIADNYSMGRVEIDEDNNIYVDISDIGRNYPSGTYYLEVEAAKDPVAEKASKAQTKLNLLEPIREIKVNYASAETIENIPVYRANPGQALVIAAPKVGFGQHQTGIKDGEPVYGPNVPKVKKINWDIAEGGITYIGGGVVSSTGVSIDHKTGRISLSKNFNLDRGVEITVTAKATDFDNNDVETSCKIVVLLKGDK